MEELFWDQLLPQNDPDIELCIFPHLKEFIAIDLRFQDPVVELLDTSDVFDNDFSLCVEQEISEFLKDNQSFPFAHLINLPNKIEEIVRGVAMTFVLNALDIDIDDEENVPSIVVYVINGGSLSEHSDQLVKYLTKQCEYSNKNFEDNDWAEVIYSLRDREKQEFDNITKLKSYEAFNLESLDYFTFWENRN
ncbi:MAG TPA: hypothetical protein DEZ08_06510 [Dehalococcoidia bacterium]|jgi:hypothetical protein|nr:hypothetical protein [Dehalococcoidia bacterium]